MRHACSRRSGRLRKEPGQRLPAEMQRRTDRPEQTALDRARVRWFDDCGFAGLACILGNRLRPPRNRAGVGTRHSTRRVSMTCQASAASASLDRANQLACGTPHAALILMMTDYDVVVDQALTLDELRGLPCPGRRSAPAILLSRDAAQHLGRVKSVRLITFRRTASRKVRRF
jgi:hypothetical protein